MTTDSTKSCVRLRRGARKAIDFLAAIPVIGILFQYDVATHKASIAKFVIFWVVSILPYVVGAVIQPSTSQLISLDDFVDNVDKQFRSASALAFTVSFITPMIYLVLTRFKLLCEYAQLEAKVPETKNLPRGIYLSIILALFLMLCAVLTYTANYTNNNQWIFWKLMYNHNLIYALYFASLYLWYISMLIDLFDKDPKTNFLTKGRTDADDFSDDVGRILDRVKEDA
jgi:ABC-type multidrug transport system fused ATPase/permease subunit